MSTFTCPNGHASTASDYCDTCGVPIPAGAPDGPPRRMPPHRRRLRPAPQGARPATPAEPCDRHRTCPNCGAPTRRGSAVLRGLRLRLHDGHDAAPARRHDRNGPGPRGATARRRRRRWPRPIAVEWVAEVWVDPDWYDAQESDDPCPSPGLPVGRRRWPRRACSSAARRRSRNIHPEIDCSGDTGVSRRQAQLTTDGQRWWVEDLQSSNGTYVGPASGPLPTTPSRPASAASSPRTTGSTSAPGPGSSCGAPRPRSAPGRPSGVPWSGRGASRT